MSNPSESCAIYAGSFDLLTVGHMWMIQEGSRLFDRLVVAIGDNPAKKSMFSAEERKDIIEEATQGIENVAVTIFSGQYLYVYAERVGAEYILRGIRNSEDFEYERIMRNLNGDFAPSVQTVFLMPPRDIAEVSSSIVKGLIGPDGWQEVVKPFVPSTVFTRLAS